MIKRSSAKTPRVAARASLVCLVVLVLSYVVILPASAQVRILWDRSIEDSLLSPDWTTRQWAVSIAQLAPDSLSLTGRERALELLQRELDETIPVVIPPDCCAEEGYAGYLSQLIYIVERFNDPRATPLLARQGIAWSMSSRFQVARAGDAAVPMLVGTWDRTPPIRHGVVATFGIMVRYADSVSAPLSAISRETARRYILDGLAAPESWLRRSAVDAALTTRDPSYLPVLRLIAERDQAVVRGRRYVALRAGAAANTLAADSASVSVDRRLSALNQQVAIWCSAHSNAPPGLCQSLEAKLDAGSASLARGNKNAAKGQFRAFGQEVQAKGEATFGPVWYAALVGNASALVQQLN